MIYALFCGEKLIFLDKKHCRSVVNRNLIVRGYRILDSGKNRQFCGPLVVLSLKILVVSKTGFMNLGIHSAFKAGFIHVVSLERIHSIWYQHTAT